MRRMIRDAHAELLKGLQHILGAELGAIPMLTVSGAATRRWASATYSGQRHVVEVRLRGDVTAVAEAGERIAAMLPGLEFDLPGHLVASVALTEATTHAENGETVSDLRFEVLTIEESED